MTEQGMRVPPSVGAAVTEQQVRLPLGDGAALYGKFRAAEGAPVVVLVHGLTGHMDEALHYTAARRLHAEGFAVLRFNLYGDQFDTRRLTGCTTTQHARDLDSVLRQLRGEHPNVPIVVAGHSLGGLTALLATEPIDAIVLWDASHTAHFQVLETVNYVESLDLYRWRTRVDHLLNPAMLDELKTLDSDALIAEVQAPVLVIAADDGVRPAAGRQYAEHAPSGTKLVIVPDSDHTFSTGESTRVLLDETVRWLRGVLV